MFKKLLLSVLVFSSLIQSRVLIWIDSDESLTKIQKYLDNIREDFPIQLEKTLTQDKDNTGGWKFGLIYSNNGVDSEKLFPKMIEMARELNLVSTDVRITISNL
ncbi:MAG: hypothetical protein P4L22_06020 [Candidatus Babeliales bacterium]|nr:hypothetical protein [Candidatus Babeliales bacterium]